MTDLLTPRQLEILELVSLGKTNAAIAARLGLSKFGVDHAVITIRNKLEARDRAHAVRRAFEQGLLPVGKGQR